MPRTIEGGRMVDPACWYIAPWLIIASLLQAYSILFCTTARKPAAVAVQGLRPLSMRTPGSRTQKTRQKYQYQEKSEETILRSHSASQKRRSTTTRIHISVVAPSSHFLSLRVPLHTLVCFFKLDDILVSYTLVQHGSFCHTDDVP